MRHTVCQGRAGDDDAAGVSKLIEICKITFPETSFLDPALGQRTISILQTLSPGWHYLNITHNKNMTQS